jgi:hypothetical protein
VIVPLGGRGDWETGGLGALTLASKPIIP